MAITHDALALTLQTCSNFDHTVQGTKVGKRALRTLLGMRSCVVVANKWIREFGQEFRRPCGRHVDDTDEELYLTEFGQEFRRPRG